MADREVQKFSYAYLKSHTTILMVCVYKSPDDYPDLFLARVWDGKTPTNLVATGKSLEELRRAKPPEMTILPRIQEDATEIVESWI